MSENIRSSSDNVNVLVISACPADLQFCLGVIKKQPTNTSFLMVITWAKGKVEERLSNIIRQDKGLALELNFISSLNAYSLAQEKRWSSIYLFTMGADWLGKILYERKDILRYRDCYMDYQQLELRDIKWKHLEIIKFHGLKFWLKLQTLRALTFIKYHNYKLDFRPDMHVWPQTEDIKEVWEEVCPDDSFKLAKLPSDSVIFCLSSIDNGWAPNWTEIKNMADNFFYKIHPRTGSADYLAYPDWVLPLEGYDLPIELYDCPDSSLLVGTTSTALGASHNSISLWKIKLLDWKKMNREYGIVKLLFKNSSLNFLNCRNDLQPLYKAYAERARYIPKDNRELVNAATRNHI